MALEQAIVDWAGGRPAWQQQVLHELALGGDVRRDRVEATATALATGQEVPATPLTITDLPGARSSGQTVLLRSVAPIEHVNALADGQILSFDVSGITCVYGDNGSGKSGYARLVKQLVRARHREEILTDIFNDRGTDVPSALIAYAVDGAPEDAEWPKDSPVVLRQISYYDEACGDAYLSRESAVTYRPAALLLLDGLITVCDAVRDELDRRLAANVQRRVAIPELPDGTPIRDFIDNLSGATAITDLDDACALPDDPEAALAGIREEEARLRTSDPTQERRRLATVSSHLKTLAGHLDSLYGRLDDTAAAQLAESQARAKQMRAAASVASSATFDAEPVSGVGSATWRGLWDAARRFSETEAYPTEPFPVVGDESRCPLCQQALSTEARQRLHRFHQFMADDTERQAADAERGFEQAVAAFRSVEIQPTAVALALAAVESGNVALAESCRSALARLDERKIAILARVADDDTVVPEMPELDVEDLHRAADELIARAAAIDDSELQRRLADLAADQRELEGRQRVASVRDQVVEEIARLRERSKLESARRTTSTTGITAKATELTRDHVTALVRDRFTRESHDLRLQKITLQDTSGRKGQLLHRPAFLGARQDADLPAVLSEGEQTALGLAGFLTEAYFDDTKSAIVLDDPVTSLDHVRRPHVAQRLCELAADRQVIVFTHDVSFVGDLRKASEAAQVGFTERCVERRRDGLVGICSDQHPWSARDARSRLGELEAGLARIQTS